MGWTQHARFSKEGELEVSTALLKHLANVTDPIIHKWKERGLTTSDRGWWDLAHVIAFFRNGQHRKTPDAPTTGDAKTDADIRLKNAKAELAELDLAIRKGEYYRKDEIHAEWATRCAEVRASLLNLCKTIPIECAGKGAQEIEGVMTEYVEAILQEFQRGNPEAPSGEAESEVE
jgi:phage terminase Nu1 subunit (DNA packaging protein)